jgi:hypothetical protein
LDCHLSNFANMSSICLFTLMCSIHVSILLIWLLSVGPTCHTPEFQQCGFHPSVRGFLHVSAIWHAGPMHRVNLDRTWHAGPMHWVNLDRTWYAGPTGGPPPVGLTWQPGPTNQPGNGPYWLTGGSHGPDSQVPPINLTTGPTGRSHWLTRGPHGRPDK